MRKASRTGNPCTPQAMGPGSALFLLRCFKRILASNTAALERMAQMDRALSGEYVFDKGFLEIAVRDVLRLTHESAYHLNGMANEGYVELYDAYQDIRNTLEDILAGGVGPAAGRRWLPFSELNWEMEPVVGLGSVGLAVLGHKIGLPAPDGFAVTSKGLADLRNETHASARAELEQALSERYARRSGARTLTLTLLATDMARRGQILDFAHTASIEDSLQALERFADQNDPDSAVCVRPRIEAAARGTLRTLAKAPELPPAMLLTAHEENTPELCDRYWLSRAAPHAALRSRIASKSLDAILPGGRPLDILRNHFLRGSGYITQAQATELADIGLAADRALGEPCELSWVLTARGKLWLTGMSPAPPPHLSEAEEDVTQRHLPLPEDALLQGGAVACGGVGAGPLALLDEDAPIESVPLGAVGVSYAATPGLSRFVPRLSALLAEVGSAASHLATVSREHRVPALFGLKGATSLQPDTSVTVDANEAVVYAGVIESLLQQAALQETRVGAEPEYLTLRRLLRHIRPLELIDPDAAEFTPSHCRSCNDVLHFAHETAVGLLLTLESADRSGLAAARRLVDGTQNMEYAPLALDILDMGDGLTPGNGPVRFDEIHSLPLRAFLKGLIRPEVRRQGPARLSFSALMAGAGRSDRLIEAPTTGRNIAIASREYANITLQLGYHFSVVDALVSEQPEHAFVYFRYAGGFADRDRRVRRAELIQRTLSRLGFQASCKGDLVIGKRSLMEQEDTLEALHALGALCAFTRQLDTELGSEEELERCMREFQGRYSQIAAKAGT